MSYNRDWDAFNRDVIIEFRANGGQVPGRKYPLILLTTTGAKSGLPRTTPLNYSTDGDRIIVIAPRRHHQPIPTGIITWWRIPRRRSSWAPSGSRFGRGLPKGKSVSAYSTRKRR